MKHAAQLGPGRYSAALATVHFSRSEYAEALDAIEDVLATTPHYTFARAIAALEQIAASSLPSRRS